MDENDELYAPFIVEFRIVGSETDHSLHIVTLKSHEDKSPSPDGLIKRLAVELEKALTGDQIQTLVESLSDYIPSVTPEARSRIAILLTKTIPNYIKPHPNTSARAHFRSVLANEALELRELLGLDGA